MGRFSCQGRRRLSHYLLTSSGVNPRRTGRSAIGLFVRFEFFEAKRNERSGKPGTATPSGAKENNNINQNATITTTTIRRTQTHTHTRTHTHTDTPTQPHTHTHTQTGSNKKNEFLLVSGGGDREITTRMAIDAGFPFGRFVSDYFVTLCLSLVTLLLSSDVPSLNDFPPSPPVFQ